VQAWASMNKRWFGLGAIGAGILALALLARR
jgi:hypothetical protein